MTARNRTTNIEQPTSNNQHRTTNIEQPTSNIEHRTSNIEHPTTNIPMASAREGSGPGRRSRWVRQIQTNHSYWRSSSAAFPTRQGSSSFRLRIDGWEDRVSGTARCHRAMVRYG